MLRAGKVSPLVKSPLIKAPQNLHFMDIIVISLYDLPASNLAFSPITSPSQTPILFTYMPNAQELFLENETLYLFSASKPIVAAIGHKIDVNESNIGEDAALLLPPATNVSDIIPKIGDGEGLYAVSFYPPFVPPPSNNNETTTTMATAGVTSGSITFTGNLLLLHSSYPFPPFDDTQPFGVTYTVDVEVRRVGAANNISSAIRDNNTTTRQPMP